MNLSDYWNYILGGVDLVGLVALRAVGKKKAVGWLWAMFTQALWIVYSLATLQWGFLVPAVIKCALYTWNWLSWLREDRAVEKAKTHQELAADLVKQVIPDANGVTQAQAISFLTRAITVASLYPEKTKAGSTT
ncbi:hypothetical protein [Streptomyces griseoaurantiacus]|uniref:hypothetical protein n=1 Tax=Streptomyces griseoaurantiacus TaxID=68213 RepID=UPI0036984696